jgi:hypothetical protein
MKILLLLSVLSLPTLGLAQKLPGNLTCQDLIDVSNGKLSRSNDGGRTYVPINRPQPADAFDQTLLSYDTHLCGRLSRGEITVAEFNALQDEKALQLRGERAKVLAEQKALENQQRAVQNQNAAIQTQKEAVHVQRQTAVIQALQAEAARKQQERQHQDWMRQQQIQQQQLEQIRQEQARPKSFSCFGSGNFIQCN